MDGHGQAPVRVARVARLEQRELISYMYSGDDLSHSKCNQRGRELTRRNEREVAVPRGLFAWSNWLIEEAQKLIMEPLERGNMKIARGCNERGGLSNQMAQSVMDGRGIFHGEDEAACSCAPERRRLLHWWWWWSPSRFPRAFELRFSDGQVLMQRRVSWSCRCRRRSWSQDGRRWE